MLSALILSERSYPALQLVPKPADQRFVHPGPLVAFNTDYRGLDADGNRNFNSFRFGLCFVRLCLCIIPYF